MKLKAYNSDLCHAISLRSSHKVLSTFCPKQQPPLCWVAVVGIVAYFLDNLCCFTTCDVYDYLLFLEFTFPEPADWFFKNDHRCCQEQNQIRCDRRFITSLYSALLLLGVRVCDRRILRAVGYLAFFQRSVAVVFSDNHDCSDLARYCWPLGSESGCLVDSIDVCLRFIIICKCLYSLYIW